MRIWSSVAWIASASAIGAAVIAACGNGAVGVQYCRQIQTARCEAAPACPSYFNLSEPVPDGDPVAACVRYYNDQCLHGLVTTVTPSSVEVNQCVAAIVAAGKAAATERDASVQCQFVANPWNPRFSTACVFLDGGHPGRQRRRGHGCRRGRRRLESRRPSPPVRPDRAPADARSGDSHARDVGVIAELDAPERRDVSAATAERERRYQRSSRKVPQPLPPPTRRRLCAATSVAWSIYPG